MIIKNRILITVFVFSFISGIDNKDAFQGFTSKLSKYSIVNPQVIHRGSRSINRQHHLKDKYGDETVSYAVNINNQKHVIHLRKNRDFLHPNFVQYSRDAAGNYDTSYPKQHVHCYYHGEVEGYKDSMVALSMCSGLRGVIFFENKAFGLEPVSQSTTNDHLLYLLEDVQTEPITCGVVTEATSVPSHEPFEPGQSLTSLLRRKRNLPQTSYVELVLVVDNLRYTFKKNNATAVREEMVQMANLLDGTVCSASSSGGINVFSGNNLAFVSTVVAHEMGHNLGMNHDAVNCACNGKSCIMSGGASGVTHFSQCSAADFEALILRGGGLCLRNQPAASNVISNPECGNGLLEQGEQCDCGKPQECTNKCCNAATCTFTRGSACAHGACCENCQLKVAGTTCRDSVNTCDLPEYCNGRNESCPNDFYLMDGLPCQNNAAYCYEGRCQTYDYQCGHLFAPDNAIKAADICFQDANIQGDRFGNCGRSSKGDYIKCTVANSMCGKVQCTNVNVINPPLGATITIKIVAGKTCVNADFDLGTDVLDPAYVNPGSPCATGKTCVNFQCVNASALLPNLICDAKTTCNGQGVCNNLGHCHCENGWGPPYCDRSGWGGSIDSGPAQIDYSLRNGLLIFFLLVVPLLVLLILVLLYVFRRESLEPCLKRLRKTQTKNTNAGSNSNAQTGARTIPPPERPTNRYTPYYSLRNGLLIFFLLVVPLLVLLILVLLYVFRRESLEPCLKRLRKTQTKNTNAGSNSNAQRGARTIPPPERPTNRPAFPAAASTPVSGFRYGETNYWDDENSHDPPQQPPPVQGPGVPRPIQPKQLPS
ncbi:disintegrin and metalloproteinase domain-containing protein 9-like [Neolamprologus brichardi]|uniref:disintegrin and metalloproteinase domain-containing protein 9-like n=1 Tax=Neolamprologus brichardi TaxID=32507 RepID=UPI001643CBFF|nr:disintegrin and metalloproteinase domain-containing protein 9-like [Neolamprologus brichardi]